LVFETVFKITWIFYESDENLKITVTMYYNI